MGVVDDARALAERAHAGQQRKGGLRPYIGHPAAVAAAAAAHGAGPDAVAAAWLHDVVEDTACTLDDVRAATNERVAQLVAALTEPDKRMPWEDRKRAALQHVADGDRDAVLLKACDTLSNAQDVLRDLGAGEDVWERFNRPRQKQLWWYLSVARLVRERLGPDPLARELSRTVDEVCLAGVRVAGEADLQAVLGLVEHLFASPGVVPDPYVLADAQARARWWIDGNARVLLLADAEDGTPAAYAAAAADIESIRFGRRCWVEDLVTRPDQRGNGLGASLLGAARAWGRAHGCSHLELDTGNGRRDAHRFYEREGGASVSRTYAWTLD